MICATASAPLASRCISYERHQLLVCAKADNLLKEVYCRSSGIIDSGRRFPQGTESTADVITGCNASLKAMRPQQDDTTAEQPQQGNIAIRQRTT